jgi:hypothetical protein
MTTRTVLSALPADVQKALKRAAKRGTANLPAHTLDLEQGWLMVEGRQVAYTAARAFRL